MSVCGARHLQHNAHQSELTLPHPKRLLAAQPPCTPTRSHPSPLRVHCRLLRCAVRGSCAVRPQPTRAPPITPHVTATGYWRVCGFARDSTETLAFQRHTHTHITKPRAQYARVHGTAHQLPWSASLQSMMRDPLHTARACNAVHAATGQHHSSSRSPDHSQPSTKTSTARQLERQPVGRQAAQPHMAAQDASRA